MSSVITVSNLYEPEFINGKYIDKKFSKDSFLTTFQGPVQCQCNCKYYLFDSFKTHIKSQKHKNWLSSKEAPEEFKSYKALEEKCNKFEKLYNKYKKELLDVKEEKNKIEEEKIKLDKSRFELDKKFLELERYVLHIEAKYKELESKNLKKEKTKKIVKKVVKDNDTEDFEKI